VYNLLKYRKSPLYKNITIERLNEDHMVAKYFRYTLEVEYYPIIQEKLFVCNKIEKCNYSYCWYHSSTIELNSNIRHNQPTCICYTFFQMGKKSIWHHTSRCTLQLHFIGSLGGVNGNQQIIKFKFTWKLWIEGILFAAYALIGRLMKFTQTLWEISFSI